jgi:hypothetical protein
MQSGILQISIGIQFFLLVGYLLYMLFRSYSMGESRTSLLSYVAGLLTLITLGLFFSLVATASLVPVYDRPLIVLLVLLDMLGVIGLVFDLSKSNDEEAQQPPDTSMQS